MTWATTKTKIRRFLRDPSGNIWADAFLLRVWNTAQHRFRNHYGMIEDAVCLKSPPEYDSSYTHDWEGAFATGEIYRAFRDYDPESTVFCYDWETEILAGSDADSSDSGIYYTYPWEAYTVSAPGMPPPFHAPDDFEEMIFAAWDRVEIEPTTKREIMDNDSSWKTHTGGQPQKYYRDEEITDTMYLWPTLSLSDWNDAAEDEADPDTADYGSTTLDIDDNILLIVKKAAAELTVDGSISDYPTFLLKYIDHMALIAAYSTNTDGRIESLRDYWQYRADVDKKLLDKYKIMRRVDRDYQLNPAGIRRNRRHMQLPDTYPAVYP